jgi:hypothetical protein
MQQHKKLLLFIFKNKLDEALLKDEKKWGLFGLVEKLDESIQNELFQIFAQQPPAQRSLKVLSDVDDTLAGTLKFPVNHKEPKRFAELIGDIVHAKAKQKSNEVVGIIEKIGKLLLFFFFFFGKQPNNNNNQNKN